MHLNAGSICQMKRNTHTIVPETSFRLLQGREQLSSYKVGSVPSVWGERGALKCGQGRGISNQLQNGQKRGVGAQVLGGR